MKPGSVFVLDLEKLDGEIDPALLGKHCVVLCLGRALKRDCLGGKPYGRYVLGAGLFDAPPALAKVAFEPLVITHWSQPGPAVYHIPDGPLPAGVSELGKLKKPPKIESKLRVYNGWDAFVAVRHHEYVERGR